MKMMPNAPVLKIYKAMYNRWGAQHWWPGETRLEMMLGAILTQNTAWTNVEKAIASLKNHAALNLKTLHEASLNELAEWIRPAGYFNQKAGYIKAMTEEIIHRFDGSLDRLFALETAALREELLSWKGVGPETADSILLYAAARPVFVVDAYTKRFLLRHGWCAEDASYNDIARLFTEQLAEDVHLFNEFHALIVRLGKEHCRTKPKCGGCPLAFLLPAD